jgi:hypothetical protein
MEVTLLGTRARMLIDSDTCLSSGGATGKKRDAQPITAFLER